MVLVVSGDVYLLLFLRESGTQRCRRGTEEKWVMTPFQFLEKLAQWRVDVFFSRIFLGIYP